MGEPIVKSSFSTPHAVPGPAGPGGDRITVISIALGVLLLTETLRVFLPSLITIFGRAGDTPPERMGLFAALWFVLPLVALPLSRHRRPAGPRPIVLGGAVLLVLDRLALQATDGGNPQLYVAGAGVSFGLMFLYGCALTASRDAVPAGLAAGLAACAVTHLLLNQVDLVWRDGPLPWLAVVVVCAGFLWCVRSAPAAKDVAPPGVWFVFGLILVLNLMYLETIGLAGLPDGGQREPWTVALAVAGFVAGQFMMVIYAARPPRQYWTLVALPVAALAMILYSMFFMSVFMSTALGWCLGVAGLPAAVAAWRSGVALLGGMLVFLVAVFLYYAAYDIDLGFTNTAVPAFLVGLVVAVALTAVRRGWTPDTRPPRLGVFTAVTLAVATLAGAVTWRPLPAVRPAAGDEFTLIAYNIRMGFGLKGTLDLDRIAGWARGERPDVVVLSEVDRGWLLNGGHDDLARIAAGLGMRYHFAPAADSLWGDAIITNLPVRQIASHPLGGHGHPTGAQAQAAVLEVGGHEVGLVNTHLQAPHGQAPEVAALVEDLAAGRDAETSGVAGPGAGDPVAGTRGPGRPRPVLVAGDLNTTPQDPEMNVLRAAGLSDPLTALGDPPTSPADGPVERIDHVLVTRGLTAVEARVPRVTFSDHLPVVVRLRLTTV